MSLPISPYASKLQGVHVLIIGGSSGIGLSLASAVLSQGGKITISSSSMTRITSAVLSLQVTYPNSIVHGWKCDLSDSNTMEAALEQLFAMTTAQGGPIDHVVYTAADKLSMMELNSLTADRIVRAGTVRFVGPLLMAKVASRYLRRSPACSITLTSGSIVSKPLPNWSVIAGYGAAIEGLARNLALDLMPIRVNVVEPAPVDSPLWGMSGDEYERFKQKCAAETMTGFMGSVDEVIEAFMLCLRSRDVDAAVIRSHGGSIFM